MVKTFTPVWLIKHPEEQRNNCKMRCKFESNKSATRLSCRCAFRCHVCFKLHFIKLNVLTLHMHYFNTIRTWISANENINFVAACCESHNWIFHSAHSVKLARRDRKVSEQIGWHCPCLASYVSDAIKYQAEWRKLKISVITFFDLCLEFVSLRKIYENWKILLRSEHVFITRGATNGFRNNLKICCRI